MDDLTTDRRQTPTKDRRRDGILAMPRRRRRTAWLAGVVALAAVTTLPALGGDGERGSGVSSRALAFFENQPADYDYGVQLDLPPSFGEAEFTLELWIRLDASYPVGSTAGGAGQLVNWSSADEEPYSTCCWWFEGNFLLDGHNNENFIDGTFSLQFYGGGRLRWLFGDGASEVPGGVWSVGAFPATGTPSLLDDSWHRVHLIRRWSGATSATLELWIDGGLIATETSPARTDMRTWWDAWPSFPRGQEGWFWGVEKQAAIGVLSQYEDYKGAVDSIRFYDRALTPVEVVASSCAGSLGLVADFALEEGMGDSTCDLLEANRCIALVDMKPGFWSSDAAPLCSALFVDGFESGDLTRWESTP